MEIALELETTMRVNNCRKKRNRVAFATLLLLLLCLLGCSITLWEDFPEVISISPEDNGSTTNRMTEIVVKFSEKMNRGRSGDAFSLMEEETGAEVSGDGEWSEGDTVYRFSPRSFLKEGTLYLVTIYEDAENEKGRNMEDKFLSRFQMGSGDSWLYVVQSTPVDGAVATNYTPEISLSFSEKVMLAEVVRSVGISPTVRFSFQEEGGISNRSVWKLILEEPLSSGNVYHLSVAKGCKSVANKTMKKDFSLRFTCGEEHTPLHLLSAENEKGVPLNLNSETTNLEKTNHFRFHFSRAIVASSLYENFIFSDGVTCRFLFEDGGRTLIAIPEKPLLSEKRYRITIKNQIVDESYNRLRTDHTYYLNINGIYSRNLKGEGFYDSLGEKITDSYTLSLGSTRYRTNFTVLFSNPIDPVSGIFSLTCEYISGAGSSAVRLYDVRAFSNGIRFSITNLSPATYYKLKVNGKEEGVRDIYQNQMAEEIKVLLRT